MTIKGVKKLLNSKESGVDEINNLSIKARNIKNRLEKISNLLRKLKN